MTRSITFISLAVVSLLLVGIVIFSFSQFVFAAGTPSAPEYVGGVDGGGALNSGTINLQFGQQTGGKGVFVSGNYAYVVTNSSTTACSSSEAGGNGCELKVFDISNPASPDFIGGGDASGSTNTGTTAGTMTSVFVSGNYAYVTKANSATTCSNTAGSGVGCELQIWDISTPSTPTYVAGCDVSGACGSGTGSVSLTSVAVSGNTAITVGAGSATTCTGSAGARCEVMVWDVTTPTAPTYASGGDASGSSESGTGNLQARDVVIIGTNAYTVWNANATACSATDGSAIGCELKVWDISTPTAIDYVGGGDDSGATNASTTASANFTKITGMNGYVFVSAGAGPSAGTCSSTAGQGDSCELMVWDISTPSAPAYVAGVDSSGATGSGTGNIDTYGMATTSISGSTYLLWTAVASATACSQSDGMRCELMVIDITTPTSPDFVGGGDWGGATNSGTEAGGSLNGVAVSSTHAYAVGSGSSEVCSATPGSGMGCEMKVWELVATAAAAVVSTRESVWDDE